MNLAFGLRFDDLYEREGLLRVDAAFLGYLGEADRALCEKLQSSRTTPPPAREESELLVALAPHVEDFLARLFGIEAQARALAERHNELAPLYAVKRLFVQRRALHKVKPEELEDYRPERIRDELEFARQVAAWLRDEPAHAAELREAARYAAWATLTPEGKDRHRRGILFKTPRKLDFMRLVPVHTEKKEGFTENSLSHLRLREGFALTDPGTDLTGALDEANYCIWCHEQGKDSCAKGLKEKAPLEGFRKTVFGVPLAGCPLEERISEFQMVKARGQPLAALGIITVDNPMVAGTGHRICNDCMKSCIYQKQDPVNIPQAETRTLKDVLELPWGFEIYSLLTRWNPFDLRRPYPKAATGKRVLVVGLGPAGFTVAHHLMNDGHTVVGIDGLKIEPLPEALIDVAAELADLSQLVAVRDHRQDRLVVAAGQHLDLAALAQCAQALDIRRPVRGDPVKEAAGVVHRDAHAGMPLKRIEHRAVRLLVHPLDDETVVADRLMIVEDESQVQAGHAVESFKAPADGRRLQSTRVRRPFPAVDRQLSQSLTRSAQTRIWPDCGPPVGRW